MSFFDDDEDDSVSKVLPSRNVDVSDDNLVFSIDRNCVFDDSLTIADAIEKCSTKAAEAKRAWHLTKAARDARFEEVKLDIRRKLESKREALEGDKKKGASRVTDAELSNLASTDQDYRTLVNATIDAEAVFDICNGRLSAATTKAKMLQGLLFALGRQSNIENDANLSGFTFSDMQKIEDARDFDKIFASE